MGYEYRLRWQRVGLAPTSKIFQTEKGAVGKAERMLELDEIKGLEDSWGGAPLGGMPDLVEMSLERREVGAWSADRTFDVPEPDPDSTYEPDERPRSPISADIPW